MKKEDVMVLVDTPKKARKLYKVLNMFNQPIFRDTEERLKRGGVDTDFTKVRFNGEWTGTVTIKLTEVSIKHLKQILAKECLKQGDYIVCSMLGHDYILEFKYIDDSVFPFVGSRYLRLTVSNEVMNYEGCFRYFKRYATKEEIALLNSAKEPQIGDICKFWNANKKLFTIGKLENICGGLYFKYLNINNEKYYMSCEPLDPKMTLAEVFGKEGDNE